jgi:hypothetical protein
MLHSFFQCLPSLAGVLLVVLMLEEEIRLGVVVVCHGLGEVAGQCHGLDSGVAHFRLASRVVQENKHLKFKKTNTTLALYTIQEGSCMLARTEGSRSRS